MIGLRSLSLLVASMAFVGCQAPVTPVAVPATRGDTARTARADDVAAGKFDYYLLTLSWSPEYCYNHRGAAQCQAQSRFVLHGLWPENRDGTYPEKCGGGSADGEVAAGPYPDGRLANHEWQAHGTCSGLSESQYFEQAGKAAQSVAIPAQFQQMNTTMMVAPDAIARAFRESNPSLPASSVVVSCRNGYLTEVQVCMDKGLHPMACGQGLKPCGDAMIKVPAPQGSRNSE